MVARDITNFFIYRWRYVVGYSIIALILAGVLLFAGLYVPGGVSPEEMRSAVQSENVSWSNPDSLAITSLPFHLFQARIFDLFGVYNFTIKIPSLVLALLSAVGLIFLLRRWFKPNIAVLASLIAITTGQFLFVAQSGAPGVSYIFWPIVLLLLGTQVTRGKRGLLFWKFALAAAAAMSLYTPLSIYPLLAIILATALHPHLRNTVRKLSKLKISIALGIAVIIVTPLVILIITHPQLGLTLLGAPTTGAPDILANITTLFKQYYFFWAPSTTTLMTPVFGLGSLIIILLGISRLIRTRETTRSYLIIIWLVFLIPVLIINPKFTSVVFVPAVLLLAAGLTSLINYWYRLFPLNPYARIAGLVPLIILVVTLVGSGLDRYFYGYHYDPNTAINFSKDLKLIPKDTKNLVVSKDELAFYEVVEKHRTNFSVSTSPESSIFVATRGARDSISGYTIDRIITTTYSKDADRLYVYKKAQ